MHYNAAASVPDCLLALLTSPVLLVCAEHLLERWLYACVHEPILASVIHPENPNLPNRQADGKEWMATLRGPRQSPPFIRNIVNRVMSCLGWGRPFKNVDFQPLPLRFHRRRINVGDTQVANVRTLEIPTFRDPGIFLAEPADAGVNTRPDSAEDEVVRPATPPTPGLLAVDATDNDPRIRITSREGIVEMEVRLPPRVLSTHTEVAAAFDPENRTAVFHEDLPKPGDGASHRVTQLSIALALMVGAITEAQLIGLALAPLHIITCRLVAAHHRGSSQAQAVLPHSFRTLLDTNDLSWQGIGTYVSRIALCTAMELAIDLGIWGLQYFAVTNVGQGLYGWGAL